MMSRLFFHPLRRPWLLITMFPVAVFSGCEGSDAVRAPTVTQRTVPAPRSDGDDVVAVANGQTITARELDAPLRLPLFNLEQAEYALRARELQQLLIERIVGPEAAKEGLSIDAFIDRHAASGANADERDTRRAAFIRAAFDRAGVNILLPEPPPPVVTVGIGNAAFRGNPNAPVTLVEFADFQCPHSARAQPILRRLLIEYDPLVRLVMRDLPLRYHREARAAAEAARCAGEQGKYWDYHDVLFQNQDELTRPALLRYAASVGLDASAFDHCLDSERPAALVRADADEANRIGVTSTPTFFVNGRYLKGPQPYAALASVIDAELARLGIARPTLAKQMARAVAQTPEPRSPPPVTRGAAADSVVTLHRDDLARALAQRPQLEEQLRAAPLDVEGKRLLKLTAVQPGSLYEKMGLRPDDVVMQVNGEWVHDQHNPLWEALSHGGTVTVLVMRRGLPKKFEYTID